MARVRDKLHNLALRLPPSFVDMVEARRRDHANDQGQLTLCGLFLIVSFYIELHYAELTAEQQQRFWEWIEWQLESDDEALSTAIVTCFLEGIVDTPAELHCRPFMPASIAAWCKGYIR